MIFLRPRPVRRSPLCSNETTFPCARQLRFAVAGRGHRGAASLLACFLLRHAFRGAGSGFGSHSSAADGADGGAVCLACQPDGRLSRLGYPQTFDSFAWGLAIGIAAFASLAAALAVLRLAAGLAVTMTGAFMSGFVAYEGVLFAATAVLPSGDGAFSAAVVAEVLLINSLAAVGLICLHAGAAVSRALVAAQPGPALS